MTSTIEALADAVADATMRLGMVAGTGLAARFCDQDGNWLADDDAQVALRLVEQCDALNVAAVALLRYARTHADTLAQSDVYVGMVAAAETRPRSQSYGLCCDD